MAELTNLGKKAEAKVKEWLNWPEKGFCFDRIYDRMTGFYGSSNICDFTLYRYPNFYYIESKATYNDNFPFNMISPTQHDGMLEKSEIDGVQCYVIVLFASHKRAFLLDIRDIKQLEDEGTKSVNINKIGKWKIPYIEVTTLPSRKELLDYDRNQALEIFGGVK